MSDLLTIERQGSGVAWVTMNRPEVHNALSLALCRELTAAAHELSDDSEVRAVILTGSGEKSFCAGADLRERKGVPADQTAPFLDAIGGAVHAWADIAKPTMAALNGHALGGGCELALACDFRIAVDDAIMRLTEVRLGIIPGAGGTQRLPRLIGLSRAKEMILLGMPCTAERGLQIGLLDRVCDRGLLRKVADIFFHDMGQRAPLSVAMAKKAIDRGMDVSLSDGLAIERECYNVTLYSEDRNEGLLAFAEKRTPRYRGK